MLTNLVSHAQSLANLIGNTQATDRLQAITPVTVYEKPHVRAYFHGEGLKNTLKDLQQLRMNDPTKCTHWMGLHNGFPFAHLMTSLITYPLPEDDHLAEWADDEPAITLDMLIGEEHYLGRGFAPPLIRQFLLDHFPPIRWVYVDPEVSNSRATHVYEVATDTSQSRSRGSRSGSGRYGICIQV